MGNAGNNDPHHRAKPKVPRTCMREPIRDALVSRIIDDVYPPGTRLKELALAREFNVSQAPVREALRELEALGLVQTEHYRGTHVRSVDLNELREAYQLRALLEEASLRQAPRWSERDLAEMEAEVSAMQAADPHTAFATHMQCVLRFHRKVVALSGNSLFLKAWESLAWGVRARIMAKQVGYISGLVEIRGQIVAAMRRGDGEQAAVLMRGISERLLARLQQIALGLAAPAANGV